jgi:hypothetical protein
MRSSLMTSLRRESRRRWTVTQSTGTVNHRLAKLIRGHCWSSRKRPVAY